MNFQPPEGPRSPAPPGGSQAGLLITGAVVLAAGAIGIAAVVANSSSNALATPTPPAAVTPSPPRNANAEFRDYMRELAPLMPAIFGANESPEVCAQIPETARPSALEAYSCIRQGAADVRAAGLRLRTIRTPEEFHAHHRELIAFADEATVAAVSYASAFLGAVPTLERLRRRHALSSLWTALPNQENPPAILEQLDESAGASGPSFSHRLVWLNQMHPECNRRFRCVPANVSPAALADPRHRNERGRFVLQANCDCIRVWNTLRGETTWTILTADETDLPSWSDSR